MVLQYLPDKIFGYDTDEIFAYNTDKVTWVRDRYVGCLYIFLVFCTVCWVLVGEILWRNEHFQLKDVHGIPRMWLSHPTRNMCDPNDPSCKSDFKPIAELPYCTKHNGDHGVSHRAKCLYADKHTMFPSGSLPEQVFIPTSSVTITERRLCDPEAAEPCENEYEKEWDDRGYYLNETSLTFYADVEDYIIQLTSSYDRLTISGTSLDHNGYYMECEDERRPRDKNWTERMGKEWACEDEQRVAIECLVGSVCTRAKKPKPQKKDFMKEEIDELDKTVKRRTKNLRKGSMDDGTALLVGERTRAFHEQAPAGVDASEMSGRSQMHQPTPPISTPDVFAGAWGDAFKLGKIVKMAGADLDHDYNMDNMTTRMAGTILKITVEYTNMERFWSSFGMNKVRYTYKVKEKKLPYMSREFLAVVQPPDYPQRRQYVVQHGILLVFSVEGEFGFFNIVHVLIVLTTTLTLVGAAHRMTDNLSIYLHPRKENYFHLKYEVSPDFSTMWQCPKCSFMNANKKAHCHGIPAWKSDQDDDVDYCGEARPADVMPPPPGAWARISGPFRV
jgi:hypothetical protein